MRQTLERAAEGIGWRQFPAQQRLARAQGRYLGLGLASFIEVAPGPPNFAAMAGFDLQTEQARARLEPDGRLVVFTSQAPHGQSHETTLAQVAAYELGLPLESVRVVHGDTMQTPFSVVGTGGSRAATMGSGSALGATRLVKQKILQIVSKLLEADEADLEIDDGKVQVRGVPSRALTLGEVAAVAYLTPEPAPRRHDARPRGHLRLPDPRRRMGAGDPLLHRRGGRRDRRGARSCAISWSRTAAP